MNKRQIIILIIVLALLAAGGAYYYFWFGEINYLIPGVPYNGVYNLFFRRVNQTDISSILNILGYWKDERFSAVDLREKFFPSPTPPPAITIRQFFEESGYAVYQWSSAEPDNEIKEIKKFVNPKNKIPVIVFQRRSLDSENSAIGSRVVIGIFDKNKKVIVHDYFLGNNYEISYSDFEKMFVSNGRAILAVWPKDEIKNIIKGPDHSVPYPPRLEAMDKLNLSLVEIVFRNSFNFAGLWRFQDYDFSKAETDYKKLIGDPNFELFPRAFQSWILTSFAYNYIRMEQLDEAVKVIKERVLPLNENLDEAPAGWLVLSTERTYAPYYILSLAYLKKGEKKLALENYKEMISIRNSNIDISRQYISKDFAGPRIEELEKELFPKK